MKTLVVSGKCSDLCFTEVLDENGNSILEKDGYALNIPSLCSDDYIDLEIDIETGQILGWDATLTKKVLQEEIDGTD